MNSSDPSKTPLGVAPPGYEYNFDDSPSQAWMPRLAIYTTLPVSICFIVLRIYARLRLKHKLGLDDYFCVASGFASAGFCGVMLAQVVDDMYGRHSWNIPLSAFTPTYMKESCAITVTSCLASSLVKISLLAFFRRIFSPLRLSNILIWFGIVFTAVSHATLFTVYIVYSVPHKDDAGWDDLSFAYRSTEQAPIIGLSLGAVGTFTDFYIISIPLTTIFGLRMSLSKKIGISALFATGLLACTFSAVGLAFRVSSYHETIHHAPDPFWAAMPAYALAVSEINLGIICACVPIIYPLCKTFVEKLDSVGPYWRKHLYRKPVSSDQLDRSESDVSVIKWRWSNVPNGYLKTLMSYVRGPRGRHEKRSQADMTQDLSIEMGPYTNLRSIDMDYHGYLVNSLPISEPSINTSGRKS